MGLRFDPIGGGQFQKVVREILEQERQPIKNLEARKAQEQERLNLFREFKTKVQKLQSNLDNVSSFNQLRELKVDLGDGEHLADVTVDKLKAHPGTYNIEIEQLAVRSGMISNGFEDPNERVLGIGYIVVHVPDGDSFEVFVDEKDASLRGVANLINSVKDAPIQADVIKDDYDADNPWKLLIKAKNDGAPIDFPDFYFLDGTKDFWVSDQIEAENAILKVDGFEVETASNEINNFLDGVNLHLKQARPGQPFTVKVTVDNKKVAGKVKDLVDDVNSVLGFIKAQNTVDEKTDTSKTFTGDTSLQSIEYRIRNLMHEGFPAGSPNSEDFRIVHLNKLGIQFSREGLMTFNENTFEKGVDEDFSAIADAISGSFGLVFQLRQVIGNYTRPLDGLLAMKEKGLRDRISNIDRDIGFKERMLERRAQALTEQFSRLQSSLGALQQQGQAVQAAVGGGGQNIVTQLLGTGG